MKNEEQNNSLAPVVKKKQIKRILKTLTTVYKKIDKMKNRTGKIGNTKTFALGGRFLGDIGECLASYLFDARLYKKQKPGHDGIVDDKRIEVKVRGKYSQDEQMEKKKIHISKATFKPGKGDNDNETGVYLIIFSFNLDKRNIKIEFNKFLPFGNKCEGDAKFFDDWLIYFKGKKCEPGLKIKEDKARKIGGWTIK